MDTETTLPLLPLRRRGTDILRARCRTTVLTCSTWHRDRPRTSTLILLLLVQPRRQPEIGAMACILTEAGTMVTIRLSTGRPITARRRQDTATATGMVHRRRCRRRDTCPVPWQRTRTTDRKPRFAGRRGSAPVGWLPLVPLPCRNRKASQFTAWMLVNLRMGDPCGMLAVCTTSSPWMPTPGLQSNR